MTTTNLTTPTMGGEARSGSVLMTPDEALLAAEDFDKLKQLMEARS